jgi:hypothetical protein
MIDPKGMLPAPLLSVDKGMRSRVGEKEKEGDKTSVAEPHHFYAAPAPGKNFDAAPAPAAPAPAPTLLYSKAKILK